MDDIGACDRRDREAVKILQTELLTKCLDLLFDLQIGLSVVIQQIQLVDHNRHVLQS